MLDAMTLAITIVKRNNSRIKQLEKVVADIDTLAASGIAADDKSRAKFLQEITSRAGAVLAEQHNLNRAASELRDKSIRLREYA